MLSDGLNFMSKAFALEVFSLFFIDGNVRDDQNMTIALDYFAAQFEIMMFSYFSR